MCEQPPRKKSPPFELCGLTVSWTKMFAATKLVPPSVDSYNPTFATPGGVKRPPITDDTPCRATSVPMKMWVGSLGSIARSEEHTSELQSQSNLVCRLLLEKKKK